MQRARSGSLKDDNAFEDLVDQQDDEHYFSDMDEDNRAYDPMSKRLSIVLESKGLKLDISQEAETEHYDVLLSILLGKIIVTLVKLKYRLSNLSSNEKPEELEIKEDIFDAIDCNTLVKDIIDHFKGDILIEISNETFHDFIPFINCKDSDEYESDSDAMLSFVEILFPVLTSTSQISIIETGLAELFLAIETAKFRSFLISINCPYFTLMFIKKKLIENIRKVIRLRDGENPLFELLY